MATADAFTPAERQALRLALRLATQWEETLIDSHIGTPDADQAQTIRDARRNIAAFARLLTRLEHPR